MPQVKIMQKKNRIGYQFPFDEFVSLDKSLKQATNHEQVLAVVNNLLAMQRDFALDHRLVAEPFHGAAIVKTKKGRWFLQANIHLPNADTTRNCAENNAITEARGREGERLEVSEIWFMGDKANYEEGKKFYNPGARYSPCGSCCDIIYNNRIKISGDTIVHMLPVNDGNMKLLPGNPNDKRPEKDIEPNRVFSRRISDLLPHVSKVIADRDSKIKSMIEHGYDWLKNPSMKHAVSKAIVKRDLIKIENIERDKTKKNAKFHAINQALEDVAQEYYQSADVKPKTLSIAIVRSADGHYYVGKHANNGVVMSTPNASIEAIGQMLNDSINNGITDIFIVDFDERKLAALQSGAPISIKMPDGATREQIKKAGPQKNTLKTTINLSGNRVSNDGVMVHVFFPNNPHLDEFKPEEHVISYSIKELLPYAYKNPKGEDGTHRH